MKVERLKISDIIPYEKNPRKNEAAVEAVKNSIEKFGYNSPIIVDKNNVVICGHTRLKALMALGEKEVDVIRKDKLTEQEVKAYRLADNKTAELSEWNVPLLQGEIADLLPDWDMSKFGFEFDLESQRKTTEDSVPDVKEEAKTKTGDLFQLGNHRLLCGDSTNEADVQKLLGGAHCKLLFTSPPYFDLRTYEGGDMSVDKISDFIGAYSDADFQCVNLGIITRDRTVIPYWDVYIEKAKRSNYKLMSWLVWDKGMAGSIGQQKQIVALRHEFIFLFGREEIKLHKTWEKKEAGIKVGKPKTRRMPDGSFKVTTQGDQTSPYKKMESVINVFSETGKIRSKHPATFPVGLPSEFIKAFTDPQDYVVEPFGGSGTTLIACEQLERNCLCMELSPQYCDVIIERWEQFTGQKAKLIK